MFRSSDATVVIPNLKALDISPVTELPKFANLNSHEVDISNAGSLNACVANLPERLRETEGQHSFELAAAEENKYECEKSLSTIKSKFLAAHVNVQNSLANNRAKERMNFTLCPKLANESDIMFKNLPEGIQKTEKQLSQFNQQEQEHVRDYLNGCSSSRSKDSQFKVVADRLNTGCCFPDIRAASGAHPGLGQGALPETPSQSNSRPSSRHTEPPSCAVGRAVC